jgi:hypothetical protein
MRLAASALAVALATLPAAAQTVSERIARDGLAATEAHLAAMAEPDASELFALGGVRFLRGIERALQTRYRHGLSDRTLNLPILRLALPDNPAPQPIRPELVTELFVQAAADMRLARAPLASIGDRDAVALVIDPADLWFDINANGTRQAAESAIAFLSLGPPPGGGADAALGEIRFDTADTAWLLAYTHLIAGAAGVVQAWDPTDAIAEVMHSAERFEALSGGQRRAGGWLQSPEFARLTDMVTIVVKALEQPGDAAALTGARDHLLEMVRQNQRFWRLVALEQDDDREWIPNATQSTVLPFDFPPETGKAWLAVLDDAAAVLKGELLIPHWRLGPQAGIDLSLLVADAPALGLAGVVQGADLLPYARRGPLADTAALIAFRRLVGREMPLFVITLN